MAEKISPKSSSTFDFSEVEKFSKIAEEWWDENGKFKPLHRFNPVRLNFISSQIRQYFCTKNPSSDEENQQLQPFLNLNILDIGCGGGLVCEPMARLGARVVGIDAAQKNVEVAKLHAKKMGLEIDYRNLLAEDLVDELTSSKSDNQGFVNNEKLLNQEREGSEEFVNETSQSFQDLPKNFQVVLALEVIEHVANVESFVEACSKLVAPGGLLFIATINRSLKALLTAKFAAEYVLKWLPAGTHDWNKFLKPSEIEVFASKNSLEIKLLKGFSYQIFTNSWKESEDLSVNYCAVFQKR